MNKNFLGLCVLGNLAKLILLEMMKKKKIVTKPKTTSPTVHCYYPLIKMFLVFFKEDQLEYRNSVLTKIQIHLQLNQKCKVAKHLEPWKVFCEKLETREIIHKNTFFLKILIPQCNIHLKSFIEFTIVIAILSSVSGLIEMT